MKKLYSILILLVTILLHSCSSNKDRIIGHWIGINAAEQDYYNSRQLSQIDCSWSLMPYGDDDQLIDVFSGIIKESKPQSLNFNTKNKIIYKWNSNEYVLDYEINSDILKVTNGSKMNNYEIKILNDTLSVKLIIDENIEKTLKDKILWFHEAFKQDINGMTIESKIESLKKTLPTYKFYKVDDN